MINKGFAAIYLLAIILVVGLGASGLIMLNRNKTETKTVLTPTSIPTTAPTPSPISYTTTSSVSKLPTKTTKPSTAPSPIPQPKTITVSGFAYEDRSNDNLFNSDDPKLPNMGFYIYDSSTKEWVNTTYTGQDGYFTVTTTVRGNLIIKPICNMNFCPKDGSRKFSSSPDQQQFAFRSASAPTGSNNGVIEGDLIIDGDRAYKFYLMDKNDNYYTNINWGGGHFKAENLPNDRTYIIRISYGDSFNKDETEITLTPSSPEQKTVQVHVRSK